jgi:hypothetical protein
MQSPSTESDVIDLNPEERTRCEVWTRVMGYHRPITSFNPGKQSEHADRKFYNERSCRVQAANF